MRRTKKIKNRNKHKKAFLINFAIKDAYDNKTLVLKKDFIDVIFNFSEIFKTAAARSLKKDIFN